MRFTQALTKYSPTRGVAAILAVGLLVWGLWVLLPPVAFATPGFALMLDIAVEPAWGALFAFAGGTFLIGVLGRDIEWIRRGSFLGFILWGLIALLGCVADPSATAVVTRVVIALLHAWIYIQVKIHPELITGEVSIEDLTNYKANKGATS